MRSPPHVQSLVVIALVAVRVEGSGENKLRVSRSNSMS